jgi:glutathione S-transferase
MDKKVAAHPMPERRKAYREWTTGPIDTAAVLDAITRMRSIVERMEKSLSTSKWLAGSSFSLADIAVATFVDRAEHLHFGFLWEGQPGVRDWIDRIKDRKPYHIAKPKKRLPTPNDQDVAQIIALER